MPWRHRDTKLRIIGANGQRLAQSGKVVVKSVDLRIRDASNGKERIFKPTYEVADLGCKSTVFYRTPAPIIVYYFPYITCLLYLLFLIKHVRTSG